MNVAQGGNVCQPPGHDTHDSAPIGTGSDIPDTPDTQDPTFIARTDIPERNLCVTTRLHNEGHGWAWLHKVVSDTRDWGARPALSEEADYRLKVDVAYTRDDAAYEHRLTVALYRQGAYVPPAARLIGRASA